MSDERALREKAREAVRTGSLPTRPPDQIWGGSGNGFECAICRQPVSPDDLELEIEFAAVSRGRDAVHHVHPRCFALWEEEWRNQVTHGAAKAGADLPHPEPGAAARQAGQS